jgi:hypothetical protein
MSSFVYTQQGPAAETHVLACRRALRPTSDSYFEDPDLKTPITLGQQTACD